MKTSLFFLSLISSFYLHSQCITNGYLDISTYDTDSDLIVNIASIYPATNPINYLVVNKKLYIPDNYTLILNSGNYFATFNDNHFMCGSGSEIIIQNRFATFNDNHFFGCIDMWKGLQVNSSIIQFINNTFKDAEFAINHKNGLSTYLGNNKFYNNIVGYYVPINTTGPNTSIIRGNKFSQNLTLKSKYEGQQHYYDNSHAGILIHKSSNTVITDLNEFSNLTNGILIQRSKVITDNNIFNDVFGTTLITDNFWKSEGFSILDINNLKSTHIFNNIERATNGIVTLQGLNGDIQIKNNIISEVFENGVYSGNIAFSTINISDNIFNNPWSLSGIPRNITHVYSARNHFSNQTLEDNVLTSSANSPVFFYVIDNTSSFVIQDNESNGNVTNGFVGLNFGHTGRIISNNFYTTNPAQNTNGMFLSNASNLMIAKNTFSGFNSGNQHREVNNAILCSNVFENNDVGYLTTTVNNVHFLTENRFYNNNLSLELGPLSNIFVQPHLGNIWGVGEEVLNENLETDTRFVIDYFDIPSCQNPPSNFIPSPQINRDQFFLDRTGDTPPCGSNLPCTFNLHIPEITNICDLDTTYLKNLELAIMGLTDTTLTECNILHK